MLDWLFGDKIWDTLIIIAVIAAVALAVYALIKYENARPYVIAIFCLVWFGGGVFSAYTMIDYYSRVRNQTYGELQEYDPYEDFNFFWVWFNNN